MDKLKLALLALVAVSAGGCSGGCGADQPPPPPEPVESYRKCDQAVGLSAAEQAVCDAHRDGRKAGAAEGEQGARRHIERKTADGYRLRRWASLGIIGFGLILMGTVLTALAFTFRRRRRGAAYAEHVLATIERESEAIREMGRQADDLVRALVDRVKLVLAETEHQARKLAEKCVPLEARAGEDDATRRAHLESYYARLDDLAVRVERLHVQVTVWQERVLMNEDAPIEEAVTTALDDLKAAMAELP